jgi:hypothetical protein
MERIVLTDRLFDTVLSEALLDEMNTEFAAAENPPFTFSNKFNRRMIKLADKFESRRRIRSIALRGISAVAACFLIFFIGANQTVSAYVNSFLVTVFPDNDNYLFDTHYEGDYDFTMVRATWVPEGYALREGYYGPATAYLDYANIENDNERISVSVMIAEYSSVGVDNEDVVKSETTINGALAYLYEATDSNTKTLIWEKDGLAYIVTTYFCTAKETEKIAESISFIS